MKNPAKTKPLRAWVGVCPVRGADLKTVRATRKGCVAAIYVLGHVWNYKTVAQAGWRVVRIEITGLEASK